MFPKQIGKFFDKYFNDTGDFKQSPLATRLKATVAALAR
jgi:hypothetical protein